MQKTRVGTEAVYFLLKHTFEDLQFNRAEWRCNKLNEASKKSALSFSFTFEGCLRNYMETKGTIRDTLVFSVIKDEWEEIKKALENWLLPNNFDVDGNEKVKLQNFLSPQI
jgi:hypothetical protein